MDDRVLVQASFCFENCGEGPNAAVGETLVSQATLETVIEAIHTELEYPARPNRLTDFSA